MATRGIWLETVVLATLFLVSNVAWGQENGRSPSYQDGNLGPGELIIEFSSDADTSAFDQLQSEYGLEWSSTNPSKKLGLAKVPEGEEPAWATMIDENPIVESVEPSLENFVSDESFPVPKKWFGQFHLGGFEIDPGEAGMIGRSNQTQGNVRRERIEEFYKEYFSIDSSENLKIDVVKQGDKYFTADIAGLKGHVISSRNYWEKMKIYFHFEYEESMAHIVLNGWYATGSGTRMPAEGSYKNMNTDYSAELEGFKHSLISAFQKWASS